MASPPYYSPATSPPHMPLTLPKKRPTLSVTSHASTSKRRKPGSISAATPGTSHPLRQTSFPPEESTIDFNARSPSVESDVTGVTGGRSVMTSGTGTKKGKGKRRQKGEGSVRSGAKATGDEGSTGGQAADDEEEDDAEVDTELIHDGELVDRDAAKKNLSILVDAFDADQSERYDQFRRVKLKKETLRRIVNQTLSQSVPPNVIMGISGFTKCFIGTIIERARDVQKQLATPPPTPPHPAPTSIPISLPPPNLNSSPSSPMNLDYKDDNKDKVITSENQPPMAKPASANPQYLGPLLPDHLREVMRRYKKDGEGGGTGLGGRSLGLGVTGTAVGRVRGKRLFM